MRSACGAGESVAIGRGPADGLVRASRNAVVVLPALVVFVALMLGPGFAPFGARGGLSAQTVRGWATTSVRAVEMRPLEPTPGGCVPDVACYPPGAQQLWTLGTQDVSLTAWGFGLSGLSATTLLRGRTRLGGDFVWPRSDDPFDALLAYAQLARGPWNVRLGRQEVRSGLGFSSFDGARVGWRVRAFDLDAYTGRSLARGLRDPENTALRGVEDFLPDQGVLLFGGALGVRRDVGAATLRYQRELLSDRSGLASERASLDASGAVGRVGLSTGADWDFGMRRPGKGHLTAEAPLGDGTWRVSAAARRYVPYFSMSTIWGLFEPVAYHEGHLRVSWSGSRRLGAWVGGGVRRYGDTETTVVLRPLEDVGRRAEAGVLWRPSPAWGVDGGYQLEWGPGGFLSSADLAARWQPESRVGLAAHLMSFQQIEQYRVGDGRAWGGGLSADVDLTGRFALSVGGSVLRHRADGAAGSPWNQARGWSSLRVGIGDEPGPRTRLRR